MTDEGSARNAAPCLATSAFRRAGAAFSIEKAPASLRSAAPVIEGVTVTDDKASPSRMMATATRTIAAPTRINAEARDVDDEAPNIDAEATTLIDEARRLPSSATGEPAAAPAVPACLPLLRDQPVTVVALGGAGPAAAGAPAVRAPEARIVARAT